MAARLLMSETPVAPTRADDLESFLHVLNWVALCYMSHSLNAAKLTHWLTTVFEESWADDDGSFKGGTHKQDFLRSRRILEFGLANRKIHALLDELTTTFGARYILPPKFESDPELQAVLDAMDAINQRRQARLESSDWMLETFTRALDDLAAWPQSDRSVKNEVVEKENLPNKRKTDADLEVPRKKRNTHG
jgi:hypothetical protein